MHFNAHSELLDKHSFLSPSNYHWLNYTDEKLELRYLSARAAARGSALHAFAHNAISLGIRLPKTRNTLNMYVNDAIGYRMRTEQPLYYSDNCFGTADAICFRENFLRIHDLKSGRSTVSMKQLSIYASLFFLEYGVRLTDDIKIELRIYQSDDVEVHRPDKDEIYHIMDRIDTFDRKLDQMRREMDNER